ncbi:hypothetical protein GTY65_15200 [Streptomyces sp. SID8379]|uniref:hypothetical protein n=1 Tax=unclassified Streptomyces TaxID=2593676 RepID=UPI00035EE017|nr:MULTISPECIES: hypothetical protein [unclassified Streptomyces]MYW65395.1 hypothetical protein [Streptomyces sp. SID8379]
MATTYTGATMERDETKYRAELERRFLEETQRHRGRGLALLWVAGLLWAYVALRLLLPWKILGNDPDCDAPLFEEIYVDGAGEFRNPCAVDPWPTLLGVLALSLPLSVVGAALYVRGLVTANLTHYVRSMTR